MPSRNEQILRAAIDGTDYGEPPQSRIEELLIELKETIEAGGGGGTPSDVKSITKAEIDDLFDD